MPAKSFEMPPESRSTPISLPSSYAIANSPSVPLRPPTNSTKSELWMLCVSRPISPEPVNTIAE